MTIDGKITIASRSRLWLKVMLLFDVCAGLWYMPLQSDTEADIKASINSFAPAWLTFDVIFMFVSEILSSWSDAASVSLLKLETN